MKGKDQIIELVTTMEDRRQDSLYVGTKVVNGKVKTPKTQISRAECLDLLKRIDEFLPTVETNLKTSTGRYQTEAAKLNAERNVA